jgi:hypothetical protein
MPKISARPRRRATVRPRATVTAKCVAVLVAASFVVGPGMIEDAWARKRRRRSRAKPTSLEIMSMTAGAEVFIDDKLVGKVPLEKPLVLKAGSHSIKVQKRGFTPHIDTITVRAGQQKELEVDLVPSGGVVKVSCNVRRAQVLMDGKPIGKTPFDGDVSPGKHKLEVVATGKLRDSRLIEVRAGEELKLEVVLKDVPPPIVKKDKSLLGKWWFWTGVGAVVFGGVTVGVLSARTIEVPPDRAPDTSWALP